MNEYIRKFSRYKVTYTLIAICLVVYVITTLLYGFEMTSYDALEFMGYNPLMVYYGRQYYRIIMANFIHFGIFHLVINCYSLYNVGTFVERILNFRDYVIVIVVSMITTNLIPYVLFLFTGFGYNSVGGGISGVICGLLGCLGAFALVVKGQFRDVFRGVMPSIILMLFMSIAMSSISLSGHLCGMAGGFVATYILLKVRQQHIQQQRYVN